MTTELDSDIELYDSDRIALRQIVDALSASSTGKQRSIDGFAREVLDKFAAAGFYVDVRMFTDEGYSGPESERVWYPKIVITGRIEKDAEFDHERMGHEVRSNILGVPGQDDVQKKTVGQTGFSRASSGLIVPG